ncbi:hypothetical protein BGY98DRAFT_1180543 [Russula aff. rugulosa BPL654]|nr:hypothetical protein BGY98DRAFT_1180543 [Russula aff. rugulosa BPL654]
MYRTIAVPFYQKAGIESGLSSTASSKRTNALETVAVGPVEAGRERGSGSGSIFIVLMRALYIGRFRTNSLSHPHLPNSHPPTLPPPPPPPPLHLHRFLLPNQGELSPRTRSLSTSLRTPHISPIPIHEEHGNELERAQAPRIVTSFSSRCLSALNAGLFFAIVILSGCPLSRRFSYQVNEDSPPFEQLDPPWRCTTTTSMLWAALTKQEDRLVKLTQEDDNDEIDEPGRR